MGVFHPVGASWFGRWDVLGLITQHRWEVRQKRFRLKAVRLLVFQVETKAFSKLLFGRWPKRFKKKNSRVLKDWNGKYRWLIINRVEGEVGDEGGGRANK